MLIFVVVDGRILDAGLDPNVTNHSGATALHSAAANDAWEAVQVGGGPSARLLTARRVMPLAPARVRRCF